jgi:DNA-directed RNA polymerase specialized sigma54-like protein
LNLSDEDLKNVIGAIIRLNPKPGGNMGELNKAESYIVPDFLFSIIMVSWNLPLIPVMHLTYASVKVTATC